MKVFLINLDSDKERLLAADAQLKMLGVEYERIPAVYGKSLSCAEKVRKVNRFRWWCAVGRPMTDGELGCALSHAAAYHKIIDGNLSMACVLEDDVVLDSRFPSVLTVLEKRLDWSKPQVALLSNHSSPEGQLGDAQNGFQSPPEVAELALQRIEFDMFSEGYVVTKTGAEALLKANEPIITCCDWWGRWTKLGLIELYHAFPTVCKQNKKGYASHTIVGMVKAAKDLPLPLRLLRKLKRLVGKMLDRMMILMVGR